MLLSYEFLWSTIIACKILTQKVNMTYQFMGSLLLWQESLNERNNRFDHNVLVVAKKPLIFNLSKAQVGIIATPIHAITLTHIFARVSK